jgi:hypothetical protein
MDPLAPKGALDDGFLEAADGSVAFLGRDGSFTDKLIEDFRTEPGPAAFQALTSSVCGA